MRTLDNVSDIAFFKNDVAPAKNAIALNRFAHHAQV
jgi:hypothetical protein